MAQHGKIHHRHRNNSGICLLLAFHATALLNAGTLIHAHLLQPLSSYRSKRGDRIRALVAPQGCSEAGSALPAGATLEGRVAGVRRVGLGLAHETARLQLDFSELRLPDGRSYELETRLVSVENARERVDKKGAIRGIRATSSLSSRLGSRLAWGAMGHPFLLGPALILESGFFHFPDPEIDYARGAVLILDVVFPELLSRAAGCEDPREGAPDMTGLVAGLPYWSYSKRQPQPMDLVNLMFVGSRHEVETAFAAAGWTGSHPNSMRAGFNVIRAIAEERRYADAPMRTLLLNGEEPDLTMQAALNTFDKRDHLRIWKQSAEWQGRPAWASAATRDLSTTFSMGHPFGFTHEIQKDVDLERESVVSELRLTGCVDTVDYVARSESLPSGGDSRKGVRTDSRVAVIVLNGCEQPREDLTGVAPEPPPLAVRIARRVILTARNHFLRDNIVWRSADGARLGIRGVRHWYVRRREDREAQ